MFEANLLGGRLVVRAAGPWEQVGPVQVEGHDLRALVAFLDWLRNEAAGLFGHLIGNDERARPCDLAAALQAASDRWNPAIVRADVQPGQQRLPSGAVS